MNYTDTGEICSTQISLCYEVMVLSSDSGWLVVSVTLKTATLIKRILLDLVWRPSTQK